MSEWIETAPKDGTKVLLHEPYEDVAVGYWSEWRGRWCALRGGGYDEGIDDHCRVTHWMPLPPPPVDGDKGGA